MNRTTMNRISAKTIEGREKWKQGIAARNMTIFREVEEGIPLQTVALNYSLSTERIQKIVQRAKRAAKQSAAVIIPNPP